VAGETETVALECLAETVMVKLGLTELQRFPSLCPRYEGGVALPRKMDDIQGSPLRAALLSRGNLGLVRLVFLRKREMVLDSRSKGGLNCSGMQPRSRNPHP
jgi:hypothetical protein